MSINWQYKLALSIIIVPSLVLIIINILMEFGIINLPNNENKDRNKWDKLLESQDESYNPNFIKVGLLIFVFILISISFFWLLLL